MASPLQYSCLENSMDRGPWRARVHGVKKSWTRLEYAYMHDAVQVLCHQVVVPPIWASEIQIKIRNDFPS